MERLKEKNLAFKAKSDESMRRALSMMLGGQVDLVQKEGLAAGRDEPSYLRQERALERLKKENLVF